MIELKIVVTLSKILAFLVFIVGAVYAFIFKDTAVFITSISVSSGLILGKTILGKNKEVK